MAAEDDSTASTSGAQWAPWIYINLEWRTCGEHMLSRQVLLTTHFGEHHLDVFGGRVWFGLRGVELQVTPSVGEFASEHLWPENLLEVTVEVDRKASTERREKRHGSMSAKVHSKEANAEASAASDRAIETNNAIEDVYKQVHWRIVVQGSPSSPIWKFLASPREPFLQGRLVRQQIGQLKSISDDTTSLSAELRLFKKDIRPSFAEGLWPEDISNSKHVVLMALLRKMIANRIGPTVWVVEAPPLPAEAANG